MPCRVSRAGPAAWSPSSLGRLPRGRTSENWPPDCEGRLQVWDWVGILALLFSLTTLVPMAARASQSPGRPAPGGPLSPKLSHPSPMGRVPPAAVRQTHTHTHTHTLRRWRVPPSRVSSLTAPGSRIPCLSALPPGSPGSEGRKRGGRASAVTAAGLRGTGRGHQPRACALALLFLLLCPSALSTWLPFPGVLMVSPEGRAARPPGGRQGIEREGIGKQSAFPIVRPCAGKPDGAKNSDG